MGPRFCKRGNAFGVPVTMLTDAALQWGHAFVSVETPRELKAEAAGARCFNGATLL